MTRITIITEIIAPYRIPVFNALGRRKDAQLHVIFLAETDPTQRQWQIYKDEIRFSYEVLPGLRKWMCGQNVMLNWGVERSLRRAAPEAIVCGGYNYLASWTSLRWAERNAVPFYVWVESTSQNIRSSSRITESLKRNFLSRCAGFVVPGGASSKYVQSFGLPPQKIFVAPNAVDNEYFSTNGDVARRDRHQVRSSLSLPARYFLFAGRLVKEKGIFELLAAYGALPDQMKKEVALVFVGDGPARAELEDAAAKEHGRVMFRGFAQRDLLPTYYSLAEILVFPTHTDPWGLVVNEAMSCGLPVICSDVAGCCDDLVRDRWNGRVVRAGDVMQLTSAMAELAADEQSRIIMGQRSRELIASYSPTICANGIAQAVLARQTCAA